MDIVRSEASMIDAFLRIWSVEQRRNYLRNLPQLGFQEQWNRLFLPHYFRKPNSRMHRWLSLWMDRMVTQRGTQINVIAPRGSAKSTVVTLAFVLRCAAERIEPFIWIVSDTKDQANSHLNHLKKEITENDLLRSVYPHLQQKADQWREDAVHIRGGAIEAFGKGVKIRGRRHGTARPTLIICDDIQGDDIVESPNLRDKDRQWFDGALMKAGSSNTNVINLATALHPDAIGSLLMNTPGWIGRTFRSIRIWPQSETLWADWEQIYRRASRADHCRAARRFFDSHRQEMERGASVLWPEEEDLYRLMCMRIEHGKNAFEREKQGRPINPHVCEWPPEYFEAEVWFDDWPSRLMVRTMALDPSKGASDRHGDWSAFVLLGVDSFGTIFVEADLARRNTSRMIEDGVALYRMFQPDFFGIEANAFQYLLGPEFERAFDQHGLSCAPLCMVNNQINKKTRIRQLDPFLSRGKLKFKSQSSGTKLLVDQLQEFPIGKHDDGPDALEMALRLAIENATIPLFGQM